MIKAKQDSDIKDLEITTSLPDLIRKVDEYLSEVAGRSMEQDDQWKSRLANKQEEISGQLVTLAKEIKAVSKSDALEALLHKMIQKIDNIDPGFLQDGGPADRATPIRTPVTSSGNVIHEGQ